MILQAADENHKKLEGDLYFDWGKDTQIQFIFPQGCNIKKIYIHRGLQTDDFQTDEFQTLILEFATNSSDENSDVYIKLVVKL